MDNNTNTPTTDRVSGLIQMQLVERDVAHFGTGFYRIHPDGRVEHIPFNEMHIKYNVGRQK